MSAEQKLVELGIILPPPPKPLGVYRPFLQIGKEIYVSGHGPVNNDGSLMRGRLGADVDMAYAKDSARQCGLAILATLRANLGSLDKIDRVVKVLGMINCIGSFEAHPKVINGCSELFAEVFGTESGVGVRSAVGMGSLPDNIPTEIEALFLLK